MRIMFFGEKFKQIEINFSTEMIFITKGEINAKSRTLIFTPTLIRVVTGAT